MKIILEFSADQERHLQESAARRDAAAVRALLLEAVGSTVEGLVPPNRPSAGADFEALTERLVDLFAATRPSGQQSLPDEALSREGIYSDHP